jgi:NHL repeat
MRSGSLRANRRLRAAVGLAVSVASLTVACTGTPPSLTSASPQSGTTSLPNPFTVVARYPAASLGLKNPASLAIGPDGNLYITEAKQRVTVISPKGVVLRWWGEPGRGPGQFRFIPHEAGVRNVAAAIAVAADGRVYVADSGNARVEVFSPTGEFIGQIGSYGSARGHFQQPVFLAVDDADAVLVADDQARTVSKFSASGTLQWRIGGPSGTNDPDLIGHFHFSGFDSHGRLVALNDDRELTIYLDARGRKVDSFRSDGCDITVDPAGNTYTNGCEEPLDEGHDTWVYDRSHDLIGEWDDTGFGWSPRFGPNGEVFTIGEDGSILQLHVELPHA